MRRWLFAFLAFFVALIGRSDEAIQHLKIANTVQRDFAALRTCALKTVLETESELTFHKIAVKRALTQLEKKEVDFVILREADLPKNFNGEKCDFAYEALVMFVNSEADAKNINLEQVAEFLQSKSPRWCDVFSSGNVAEIHRLVVEKKTNNDDVEKRFGYKIESEKTHFTHSVNEGICLLIQDSSAVFSSPFITDFAHTVKMLSVNGVSPTVDNIRSGKYPLSVKYVLVWNKQPSQISEQLLKKISGRDFYNGVWDEFLLPAMVMPTVR